MHHRTLITDQSHRPKAYDTRYMCKLRGQQQYCQCNNRDTNNRACHSIEYIGFCPIWTYQILQALSHSSDHRSERIIIVTSNIKFALTNRQINKQLKYLDDDEL